MPMSRPRRSFCFSPPRRFRRVFTPALLRPLLSSSLRLLEPATLFFFSLFSLPLSLLHTTFGLISYVEPRLLPTRDERVGVRWRASLILGWNAAIWKVCFRVRSWSIFSHSRRTVSRNFSRFLDEPEISFIRECARKLVPFNHLLFF